MATSSRLLHAVVELSIGDRVRTTVPPSVMEGFRYTSRLAGPAGSRMECTIFDTTGFEVEQALLGLDPVRGVPEAPITARWGFPEAPGVGEVWAAERKFRMIRFTPEYTHGGTRIQIEAAPWIDEGPRLAADTTATHRGKISDVVTQVARDLGFPDERIFVEETDVFRHGLWGIAFGEPEGRLGLPRIIDRGEQEWQFGSAYPIDYINERMLPLARSATDGRPFEPARIVAGRQGPEFHFRPVRETPPYLEVVAWFGRTDEVLSFTPELNSSLLGELGSRGVVTYVTDPDTKEVHAVRAAPNETPAGTPVSPHPPNRVGDDAAEPPATMALVTQDNFDRAQAELEGIWAALVYSVQKATLVLRGTPENMLVLAEDLIVIHATLKNGGTHWSSGRYRVAEAAHEVGSGGYHISLNLYRDYEAGEEALVAQR